MTAKKHPLLIFIAALCLYASALCHVNRVMFKKNDSFSLWQLYSAKQYSINKNEKTQSVLSDEALKEIFSSPLSYLGKGHQSVAFVSAKGDYVVKFYRFPSHMRPFGALAKPFSRLKEKRQKIQCYDEKKYRETLASHSLCFNELREESALVLAHLQPSSDLNLSADLITPSGARHRVDLNKMVFIIQKKGEMIFDTLHHLIEENKMDEAELVIKNIIHFLTERTKKGYIDHDAMLHKNYGLIDKKIFQLDTGRMEKKPYPLSEERAKAEASCITEPLKHYLSMRSPRLYAFYSEITCQD